MAASNLEVGSPVDDTSKAKLAAVIDALGLPPDAPIADAVAALQALLKAIGGKASDDLPAPDPATAFALTREEKAFADRINDPARKEIFINLRRQAFGLVAKSKRAKHK